MNVDSVGKDSIHLPQNLNLNIVVDDIVGINYVHTFINALYDLRLFLTLMSLRLNSSKLFFYIYKKNKKF